MNDPDGKTKVILVTHDKNKKLYFGKKMKKEKYLF